MISIHFQALGPPQSILSPTLRPLRPKVSTDISSCTLQLYQHHSSYTYYLPHPNKFIIVIFFLLSLLEIPLYIRDFFRRPRTPTGLPYLPIVRITHNKASKQSNRVGIVAVSYPTQSVPDFGVLRLARSDDSISDSILCRQQYFSIERIIIRPWLDSWQTSLPLSCNLPTTRVFSLVLPLRISFQTLTANILHCVQDPTNTQAIAYRGQHSFKMVALSRKCLHC